MTELSARISNPAKLSATVGALRHRVTKPLSIASTTASGAFSYMAYYLYRTPVTTVPIRSIKSVPGSFIPSVSSTELVVGAGWELYAVPAVLLALAGIWEVAAMWSVEKRMEEDAEMFRIADKKGVAASSSALSRRGSTERVRKDVEAWARGNLVRGVLATAAAVVGAFAVAWL